MQNHKLKRSLSLTLVTFYGLGTILGAGIYVLVGKVAGQAGAHMPLAFLFASIIALFTGVSYSELSSRFPVSAGEAYYVKRAFKSSFISGAVGWMVVFTGVVSAATLAHGFVGYVNVFLYLPDWILITIFTVILGAVAVWGIVESAMIALIITLIEIGGLLMVIYFGADSLIDLPHRWREIVVINDGSEFVGIMSGAFLAFYAFIGFEDMVNVAEETIHPERTLPKAIFIALGAATLLYILVGVVTVLSLPITELQQHGAPLAYLIESKGHSPALIGIIGLVSIMNGALVQIIMASRVIYGMGKQRNAPAILSAIAHKTQTPILATVLVVIIILAFAYWLPIVTLAKVTSAVILCVFIMIHLSLIKVKMTEVSPPGTACYSILYPIAGVILSVMLLLMEFLFSLRIVS